LVIEKSIDNPRVTCQESIERKDRRDHPSQTNSFCAWLPLIRSSVACNQGSCDRITLWLTFTKDLHFGIWCLWIEPLPVLHPQHEDLYSTIGIFTSSMSSTATPTPSTNVKRCPTCETDRPLDWFQTKGTGTQGLVDGMTKGCKQCREKKAAYMKSYRKKKAATRLASLAPSPSISSQPTIPRPIYWPSQARPPMLQERMHRRLMRKCNTRPRLSNCLIRMRSTPLPIDCLI